MKMIFKVQTYAMANTNNADGFGGRLCEDVAEFIRGFALHAFPITTDVYPACAPDECTELTEGTLKQAAQRLNDLQNLDRSESSDKATPEPILSEPGRLKDRENTIMKIESYLMANVTDINDADCFGSGLSECVVCCVAGFSLRAVHIMTNVSACAPDECTEITDDGKKVAAQWLDEMEDPDRDNAAPVSNGIKLVLTSYCSL